MTFAPANAGTMRIGIGDILNICRSPNVSQADRLGNALGWRPLSEQELADWRSGFTSGFAGATVDVVGWRSGSQDSGDTIAFWIARGTVSHRACTFATEHGENLYTALSSILGAPTDGESTEISSSAFGRHDGEEVTYSRVGSSVYLNISSAR